MAKKLPILPEAKDLQNPPASAGWGARILYTFVSSIQQGISQSAKTVSNAIWWSFHDFLEDIEITTNELIDPIIDQALASDTLPPSIRRIFAETKAGKNAIGAIIGMAVLALVVSAALGELVRLLLLPFNNFLKGLLPYEVLPPSDAVASLFRSDGNNQTVKDDLKASALTQERLDLIIENSRPRIPVQDLIKLALRFNDDRPRFETELSRKGWDSNDIDDLYKAIQVYPQPDDIIRFAVRDSFNEEVVRKYGYDENMPADFESEITKAGFAQNYAKYFWRSHWQLPSVLQVMDIYHRTNFEGDPDRVNIADVRDYLRINDYPVYWRDKLIRITYNLPTRIDIRKFYEAGVWDRDRTKKAYLQLGYDEEIAEALTVVAEREARPTEKDLTRSAIEQAYSIKQFNRQETLDALMEVGYDQNEAELFISLADYKQSAKMQNEAIDTVEFLYINNEIDTVGVAERLGKYNLPTEQVEQLIAVWNVRREKNISLPTQAELEEFYLNSVIDLTQYEAMLRRKNFSEERIVWTLKRADQVLQARAAKASQTAQAEQERLAASSQSKQYSIDRNLIEIEIAELNLEIADIKVALYGVTDAELKDSGKIKILELQDQIKALQLQQAQLKGTFLTQ